MRPGAAPPPREEAVVAGARAEAEAASSPPPAAAEEGRRLREEPLVDEPADNGNDGEHQREEGKDGPWRKLGRVKLWVRPGQAGEGIAPGRQWRRRFGHVSSC